MVDVDWGWGEDPQTFGVRGADWDPVDSDDANDLAEVAAARTQGWFPLPEAPLWCFIPAVWPAHARAWIRDRRVRHSTRQYEGAPAERLPWTTADYFEIEDDYNRFLASYGVPPRPAGRVWALHLPVGYQTLDGVLTDIWTGWKVAVGDDPPGPEFVDYTSDRLRELFRSDR